MNESHCFPSTQWTALYLATHGSEAERMQNRTMLVDRYRPAVSKVAGRLTWLHGDREDAVEQVLTRIVQPEVLSRVTPLGRFRGLVSTILYNHWREHWRRENSLKRRRSATVELKDEELCASVAEQDVASMMDEAVALECLEQARRSLLAAHAGSSRTALMWRVMTGEDTRPLELVALELGISANAVSKERSKLRHQFEEHFLRAASAAVTDPTDLEEEALYLWRIARNVLLRS